MSAIGTKNMNTPYRPPDYIDRSKVVNLMPEHAKGAQMRPETPVVIINRGPRTLDDKYDGHDYVLEPWGMYEITYAAALHLQSRLIVQGTKNADLTDRTRPAYVSWIAIAGMDSEAACQPFTDAELELFGVAVEALAPRPGMTVVSTKEVLSHHPGLGQIAAPSQASQPFDSGAGMGLAQELVGGSDENREAALEPVEGSDARAEESNARARGYQAPDERDLKVKSDEQPKQKDAAPAAPAIGNRGRNRNNK